MKVTWALSYARDTRSLFVRARGKRKHVCDAGLEVYEHRFPEHSPNANIAVNETVWHGNSGAHIIWHFCFRKRHLWVSPVGLLWAECAILFRSVRIRISVRVRFRAVLCFFMKPKCCCSNRTLQHHALLKTTCAYTNLDQ